METKKKYDMKPIINLMDKSINKLKELLNNGWISVKNELPPNNVAVLVIGKGISMDIGWQFDRQNYKWCKYHGGYLFKKWQKVEYWCYLPENPK